ncbi:MAG: molecular chaperone TorD family protein [Thermoanaerobaculales bacterium]|nr:molecular chaperone TorD family protein [Thermoanaerobaculales bacterium]
MSRDPDPRRTRLLAEADLLLLLAGWLDRPPGDAEPAAGDLAALAAAAGVDGAADALASIAASRSTTPPAEWLAEHARLFEGGVDCPPNETAYVRRDKGRILADIAGFYRAFGFEPAADSGEKADHIVAELQFAALLLVMAARASAAGRADDEEVTSRALGSFWADHLGAWVDLFCERLGRVARLPCLRDLGGAVLLAWGTIAPRHGLGPADNRPVADEPELEGTPYECDRCPAG